MLSSLFDFHNVQINPQELIVFCVFAVSVAVFTSLGLIGRFLDLGNYKKEIIMSGQLNHNGQVYTVKKLNHHVDEPNIKIRNR